MGIDQQILTSIFLYAYSGIYLGRAIAILALIFRKWRREKTVWGQFGA